MRGGIFRPCTPARPLSSFLVSQSFKIERSGSVKKLRGIVFFAGAFLILSNLSQPARAQTATSGTVIGTVTDPSGAAVLDRSEEHTSELQSHSDLVCRLLLEKKKNKKKIIIYK